MIGEKLANIILSKRVYFLVVIGVITLLSLYLAKDVGLRYEMPRLLPQNHEALTTHQEYKEIFGNDGFQVLIGVKDKDFYTPGKYNAWRKMGEEYKNTADIDSVFSEANLFIIQKNDSLKKFYASSIPGKEINKQIDVDSIKRLIRSYPFYSNTLFSDENDFHVMLLTVNQKKFQSNQRGAFINTIKGISEKYKGVYDSEFYYTGVPFIRASNMINIQVELKFFIALSLFVTVLVLFFLFRSFKVIMVSAVIVIIGVIWTMGVVGALNYDISAIMGLLPPLIIVIGIPNCVYLINKYQRLYLETKDKEVALKTVIKKIGHITLLTNATTAFGLGTFVFTNSEMLIEFGIVAATSIIMLFALTVVLVPVLFSYLAAPKERHTKHLEKGWLEKFLKALEFLVTNKRKSVYVLSIFIVIVSVFGANALKSTGRLIDDLPNNNKTKTDLAFYEENLSGVMPLEILLDGKKKGKFQQTSVLRKIDSVQNYIKSVENINKSISYIDGIKFVNQAFYNGNPEKYTLPKGRDKGFLKKYLKNSTDGSFKESSFMDSTGTRARISAKIYDLALEDLDSLLIKITPKIDAILNPDKQGIVGVINAIGFTNETKEKDIRLLDSLLDEYSYIDNAYIANTRKTNEELANKWYDEGLSSEEVLKNGKDKLLSAVELSFIGNKVTGFSVPFTKGAKYLINNLFTSLLIAIFGISLLMSFLFKSFWMVLITILTNMLPLIFTAGVMGLIGIPLKPSTILVFSVSLGIAVDDAIHYLAKFKQELKATNGDFKASVYNALNETGISMLYTSIILFFGFSIFMFSNYGGNQAIGLLISLTLFIAMLSNLVLLPSLLLSLQKQIER